MPIINSVVVSGGSAPATKYGINIDGWVGDVITSGANAGQLRTDQAVGTLSMPGVTRLPLRFLAGRFKDSTGLVGAVNLSSLTYIDEGDLESTFENTRITSIDLSSISNILKRSMYRMCYGATTLTSITMPMSANNSAIAPHGLEEAFENTGISTFTCNVKGFRSDDVDPWSSDSHMQKTFANCSSLRSLYFPYLTGNSFSDIREAYMDEETGDPCELQQAIIYCMSNLIFNSDNLTVHMTQQLEQDLINDGIDPSETSSVLLDIFWYPDEGTTPSNVSIVFDL